ncbi:Kelch repeat-containing F-box protein [Trema orientale]|uniref:Kelch repeat-containing F-box protein n=1 Tax=Trema orientale TaxID=63057 RepID=A0A2P5FC52_TREOI|nr:Kelch repeat-containing F-box protein [Trema orientale]
MSEEREFQSEEERSSSHTNDDAPMFCRVSSHCGAPPEKIRVHSHGTNRNESSSKEGRRLVMGSSSSSSSGLPQDADYAKQPQLIDEVEALILARVPRAEYGKFSRVNKRFLSLVKSGEIYKIRKVIGFKEPTVFMLAVGEQSWWAFDRHFSSLRRLPILPGDSTFTCGDKETLCAGTHLLVSGKEYEAGPTVWRYNLVTNQWLRGPSMINARYMFATATCGSFGYVAGGREETGFDAQKKFLSSAERYNPDTESWERLPNMHRKRGSCSGFYMDNKFYVIGGENNEGGNLTCAEAYDEQRKKWDLIPDMLEDTPVLNPRSPPLVAVANNELYSLDPSTNQLKVYLKTSKSWRTLGPAPVRADSMGGWGVAFKSLGDELLVIGGSQDAFEGPMLIYTGRPDPNAGVLNWRRFEGGRNQLRPFIYNCSVMLV